MGCSRDSIDCNERCPCYDGCPNGCPCPFASGYCPTQDESCLADNQESIVACDDAAWEEFELCRKGCPATNLGRRVNFEAS